MEIWNGINGFKALLRAESLKAESAGQLTPAQLDIIVDERWFNLFVPLNYGGLELGLPEGLRAEEALARVDGSLGWTVTLCAGANLFVGYLNPQLAAALFSNPKVCFGGSGKESGNAEQTDAGYLVSGEWDFATGAPHNTVFTANCQLTTEGRSLLNERGEPLIKSFLFLREEIQIIPNWDSMGLRATASHSFRADKVLLPPERCFEISANQAILPQPIYHYPFLQFAEATLAVNTLGMGLHFLELCTDAELPATLLKEATDSVNQLRAAFYEAADISWEALLSPGDIPDDTIAAVSRISRQLAWGVRSWITRLYPLAGMKAVHPGSELNRVFRDLFTASQHALLF